MKAWQDEQLTALLAENNEHRVFDRIVDNTRQLGFDYCTYGVRFPLPLSRQRVAMFSNYPLAWSQHAAGEPHLATGSSAGQLPHSPLPALWGEELLADARELWAEAHSRGLRVGWAQLCRDVHGTLGMFTVAHSHEEFSETEMDEKHLRLSWLTQITHIAMTRILLKKMVPEANARLSNKEVAVIRWTAEGKTTAEISEIMNLSVRTVTFHIGNVVKKLNAANKTAAAVRAAVLGLLG